MTTIMDIFSVSIFRLKSLAYKNFVSKYILWRKFFLAFFETNVVLVEYMDVSDKNMSSF